jgi:uncharacterized Zn-finger protein
MAPMSEPSELKFNTITVTAKDLPLHCPMPSMKLWDAHPRVFIDVTTTGRAMCPYCGTNYVFDGVLSGAH